MSAIVGVDVSLSATGLCAWRGGRIYVSDVETGRQLPTLWRLRRLAEALDCDIVLAPRSAPPPPVTDAAAGLTPEGQHIRDAVTHMTRLGMPAWLIGHRLGVSARTVVRCLQCGLPKNNRAHGRPTPPVKPSRKAGR